MEFLQQLLPVILYALLCILVVVLVILVIHVIKVLKNVNILIEDIENKSRKLDGVFNAINSVSNSFAGFGDKVVAFLTKSFKKVTRKRKEEKKDE